MRENKSQIFTLSLEFPHSSNIENSHFFFKINPSDNDSLDSKKKKHALYRLEKVLANYRKISIIKRKNTLERFKVVKCYGEKRNVLH